ncbi:GTPase [Planctomicrobium sp. SH527]|uniref:GTPase n=1 Tax=Planctomicrobium sp. SH527 TaxID=3448123 RepID=UPI003F5C80E4
MSSHPMSDETTMFVCELTPRGRGAVATIGVRGPLDLLDGEFFPVNGLSATSQKQQAVCFGTWGTVSPEEIVFLRTGEHAAELHCHGGIAAVQRILSDLQQHGAEVITQQQWRQIGTSLVESECAEALSKATTQRTAHHLLRQQSLFPQAVGALRELSGEKLVAAIERLLAHREFGRHLLVPWKVVLCGRPNVGKSQLINALVGFERAVVFDMPGTTRDVVTAETAFRGWPVELSDTAGMRETESELEAAGIAKAKTRLSEADLVVVVLDSTAGITDEDRQLLSRLPDAVVVWNKCDLPVTSAPPSGALSVSAIQHEGIPELIEKIVSRLVPAEPPLEAAFPVIDSQVTRLEALLVSAKQSDKTQITPLLSEWLEVR